MFAPPSPGSTGDQLYFCNAPTHDRDTAHPVYPVRTAPAKVAELVDALDLESSGETRESSSLSFRIICHVRDAAGREHGYCRLRTIACKFL